MFKIMIFLPDYDTTAKWDWQHKNKAGGPYQWAIYLFSAVYGGELSDIGYLHLQCNWQLSVWTNLYNVNMGLVASLLQLKACPLIHIRYTLCLQSHYRILLD